MIYMSMIWWVIGEGGYMTDPPLLVSLKQTVSISHWDIELVIEFPSISIFIVALFVLKSLVPMILL